MWVDLGVLGDFFRQVLHKRYAIIRGDTAGGLRSCKSVA
ncbi:hypothetical protein SBF1_7720003 [Candidatus Desulfosporosinus infrequens]|uniref:Uncharacterized protein n=1 Tax=Candidatus Desulfosporosinus infrequens TaxID=2043169 RepID=A0A2U3LRL4_9FIRM|nr:hypothetical protein SBF1_7720003 [Candidatus Desulfosporosinus infrequens]